MESCVACSNSSQINVDRIITYHPFPKDPKRKKIWLKILNLDNYDDLYRVCSDHFIPKDFRPGGRFLYPLVVPKIGLPIQTDTADVNNTTQSPSDLPPQNNSLQDASLQDPAQQDQGSTQQDLILEPVNSDNMNKTITLEDGAVIIHGSPTSLQDPAQQGSSQQGSSQQDSIVEPVNSDNVNQTITLGDGTPRRSSRKIKPVTLSDNSTYQINAQEDDTDEPDLNKKPKEVSNGMRCSAWNCPNKYPVPNLSFFGYPSDTVTRRVWIKNCGIENLVGPCDSVRSSLKVCSMHFSDEMYLNKNAKKNRLVPKAIPTIFDNCDTSRPYPADFVGESSTSNNFAKTKLHNSFTNKDTKVIVPTSTTNKDTIMNLVIPPNLTSQEYLKPKLNIVYTNKEPKDEVYACDIPGCIYSRECLIEKIGGNTKSKPFAAFDPSIENVDTWSSILGVPLTLQSKVCERHFRPIDIISHDIYVSDSGLAKVKGLISSAMPVRKLNAVKRPRVSNVNEDSFTKKTKKQSKDSPKTKSKFDDKPEGEKSLSDIAPPTPIQNQTNQTLHFNTEPIESRSNIISSELTAANPQQNILNQILPKILKNNSLSISLQPATSKQSKPVTVPSQSTKNNMIFNNLQPNFGQIRPKKNINNSDICVTVDQNINKSKQIPATRALEMAQEIEIHDLVKSEPIDDSLPIITIDDSCTDEHIPLVDDLQKIYADIPESKIMKDLYWISKDLKLPNEFWKFFYNSTGNSMVFIENDVFCDPIKRIYFRNSYVPSIFINKKRYVYKEAVKTKQDLENLLEDINDIEICTGYDGFCDEKCIGYFENTSDEIEVCRNCQMSERRLRSVGNEIKVRMKKIKELEKKIAEQKIRIANAKNRYEREKRKGLNQVIFL